MCTLSFLPADKGFHLLMNRDEQRSRPAGIPPTIHQCNSRTAIFPSEPTGGTWIGSNDLGLTFALINWYSKPQLMTPLAFSRGQIIPQLLCQHTIDAAGEIFSTFPHSCLNPFRLIGISPVEQRLQEWRSCVTDTEFLALDWKKRHWFSSGFEEAEASKVRANTCQAETVDHGQSSLDSLRRLHSSHLPAKGPYSICMHRPDACTVSFTELSLTHGTVTMRYHSGAPCEALDLPCSELSLSIYP
ncbi:MAG: NRDE family protein [bacterium]